MPSHLEDLIDQQVRQSVVISIERRIDRFAEDLTAELLGDPVVRAELVALMRAAFGRTMTQLRAERPRRPARNGRGAKKRQKP